MKKAFAATLALTIFASGCIASAAYAAEPVATTIVQFEENNLIDWVQKVGYALKPSVASDVPLWETEKGADLAVLWENEVYNYKLIRNLPTAYDKYDWEEYLALGSIVSNWNKNQLTEEDRNVLNQLTELRQNMKQIVSYSDAAWYIWEDDMPCEKAVKEEDFEGAEDNSDFKPFLVPYLQEDQQNVKGNMIIVSGGGYSSRANTGEGYPTAERFYELGYNCYVLQRRVAPYSTKDIWADMQRSIRYVRAKIEELGLGGADCLIGTGFSGGSATVLGSIAEYYGNVQPEFDREYTQDSIDRLNSDLDVALLIYGPNYTSGHEFTGLETDNPNLPAMLLVAGADDSTGTAVDNMTLYCSVADKTTVEMYTFAYAPHGFGVGAKGTNSTYWIELADSFVQKNRILSGSDIVEVAQEIDYMEFPENFTKYQTYSVDMSFGPVEVTLVTNEVEDEYILFFNAFGQEQVIAGNIMEESPILRYDRTGFFGADNATLYGGHTDDWILIQK